MDLTERPGQALVRTRPAPVPVRDRALGSLLLCCHPLLAKHWQLALLGTQALGFPVELAARVVGMSPVATRTAVRRAGRRLQAFGCAPAIPGDREGRDRLHRLADLLATLYENAWRVHSVNGVDVAMRERIIWVLEFLRAHPVGGTPQVAAVAAWVRYCEERGALALRRLEPA